MGCSLRVIVAQHQRRGAAGPVGSSGLLQCILVQGRRTPTRLPRPRTSVGVAAEVDGGKLLWEGSVGGKAMRALGCGRVRGGAVGVWVMGLGGDGLGLGKEAKG